MTNNTYSPYTSYQMYEPAKQANLRTILMRYVRNWPWFVVSLTLGLIGAYIYLLYQPKVYKSQASLLIKDEKKGIDQDNMLKELDIFKPKKVVENEMEILKSFTLMERVVNTLNLTVRYYKPTTTISQEIFQDCPFRLIVEKPVDKLYENELSITFPKSNIVQIDGKIYPVNRSIQTPYGQLRIFTKSSPLVSTESILVKVSTLNATVDTYLQNLKVDPSSKQSTVLFLTLEDRVPKKAEAILNQIISEYNNAAVYDKNLVASNTLRFIEERLKLIAIELSGVEKDVETYKSSKGITDLNTQATVFLETLKDNDAQLNENAIQLNALQNIEEYIHTQSSDKSIVPATLGISDPILLGLLSKVSELTLKRDELSRTTSTNNPLLQTLDSQIRATKVNISENIQTMRNQLSGTKQQLTTVNRQLEGMVRTLPRQERELLDITRQQAIKNNLYTYLLQKREETALSAASTVADSRTVDVARTLIKAVKPIRLNIYLIFSLIGLLFPIGLISAKDALNNKVVRRSDVEDLTQVPILGEVVESRHKEALVIQARSHSVIAEQVRTLRTNLQFLRDTTKNSQILLFTSSISGEGKSFMSLNLGASMAIVGRPTVILEMDLRKPKLHSAIGIPNPIGISNYLIGEANIDEILQKVPGYDDYYIITCGPVPPNPSELLSGPLLEQMLKELQQRFDYIVVDSPPIGLVTDAQVIAPFADATMYIVRHDYTLKNHLKMIEALYKEQRFPKLNVILNAVNEGESYYYSYNSYNYGGYYSDDASKSSKSRKRLS